MDISENYIKMCEKAKEIQANWVANSGDFVVICKRKTNGEYASPSVQVITFNRITAYWKDDFHIWLPRQDQLQAMLERDLWWKINHFYEWVWDGVGAYLCDSPSMEQLWLAYVMAERYNKQWVNGDWIVNKVR